MKNWSFGAKCLLGIAALAVTLTIVGASLFSLWGGREYSAEKSAMEYDDDRAISGMGNSYFKVQSRRQIKNEACAMQIGTMNGMETIWEYDAPADGAVEFTYWLSVPSGKAKLVWIAADGVVTTLAEQIDTTVAEEMKKGLLLVQAGNNRIKLVGVDAEVELKLDISQGEYPD